MVGRVCLVVWAGPSTLVGLVFGMVAMLTGGAAQRHGNVLEFHGGVLGHLLAWAPITGGASAVTLGHVVIGRSPGDLDRTRRHERVHVRQYERWGPLFLPAYFTCSLVMWLWGRDAYRDNPFEVEAFAVDER
ncbi:MAG: hypothetical protein KDA60_21800 [Planctomycetales bacterium]|nr:hypothetical protein [Planctomycetales bacterium]